MERITQRTNFKMENENITMSRGDTLMFNVQVFDENGQAMEVDSAFFTCKKRASSQENVFQKALGSGITQSDGMLAVRVAPEDTREVDEGTYFYDMQIGVTPDVYTIKKGILSIEQDVSW